MLRWVQIVVAFALAGFFWRWVDAARLFAILQPLTVVMSVFTAAVLVRLARGMPTLEWRSIPLDNRMRLTQALTTVALEYAGLLLVFGMLIVAVIVLLGIGIVSAASWPSCVFSAVSAGIGVLLGLGFTRTTYVVWRDLDIVRLQKRVIDELPDQQTLDRNVAEAEKKTQEMRSSNLRGGSTPPPKSWL